jgi:hypothetical protein
LISPQRGRVYIESFNGMMEWWNNGISGLKTGPTEGNKSLIYEVYRKKISSF